MSVMQSKLKSGITGIALLLSLPACGFQESLFDNDARRSFTTPAGTNQSPNSSILPVINAVNLNAEDGNLIVDSRLSCGAGVVGDGISSIRVQFHTQVGEASIILKTQVLAPNESAEYILTGFESGLDIFCSVEIMNSANEVLATQDSIALSVPDLAVDFVHLPQAGQRVNPGVPVTCSFDSSDLANELNLTPQFEFFRSASPAEILLSLAGLEGVYSASYSTNVNNTYVSCRITVAKQFENGSIQLIQSKGSVRVATAGGGGGGCKTTYVSFVDDFYGATARRVLSSTCPIAEVELATPEGLL